MKDNHEIFIQRALQLAENGLGNTMPNPMVGCVIVGNGSIIAEGWHYKSGMPHAEVCAIQAVKDPSLLHEATLYVTLEPCAHHGKTPPCIDLILQKKIPRVVIGIRDPHSKVNGLGIQCLKEAGVQVIENILEAACYDLNRRFFTFHQKHRPYILMKWAETFDGFMDIPRHEKTPNIPFWISNIYSRQLTHKWRTEEASVLIGTKTVLDNNPQLNTRDWRGKNPIRIILDRQLSIPESYAIYNNKQTTLIFTEKEKKSDRENVTFIPLNFDRNLLKNLLDELYKRNIQSIIIEGGKKILEAFIEERLWDEARIFTGEILLNEGLKAPKIKGKIHSKTKIYTDTLLKLIPN